MAGENEQREGGERMDRERVKVRGREDNRNDETSLAIEATK